MMNSQMLIQVVDHLLNNSNNNNAHDTLTTSTSDSQHSIKPFADITTTVNEIHFGRNNLKGLYKKLQQTKEQLKTFIQLRHDVQKISKNKLQYITCKDLSKDQLIDRCLTCNISHYLSVIS